MSSQVVLCTLLSVIIIVLRDLSLNINQNVPLFGVEKGYVFLFLFYLKMKENVHILIFEFLFMNQRSNTILT
jgi:hypothetical protein